MPTTLDWNTSDPVSWTNYPIVLATMRGLTTVDSENRIQPGLAARWERERDSQGREIYPFHLRPGVKWSDGVNALTANDFVFGWRRAVVGRERGEMQDVLGADQIVRLLDSGASRGAVDSAVERLAVEAVDADTLKVTLARPRNYFLARIANVYLFYPAPSADLAGRTEDEIREYFERPRAGNPLSLGPFRVESWDRPGERVRLARNEFSSFLPSLGPAEAQPERVILLKSEVGAALFERGRVDFVFVDSPFALAETAARQLQRQELLSTYFLAFNTQRPPLNRPELRRALAMALDREALLRGLLPHARPAFSLLPPELIRASDSRTQPPTSAIELQEAKRQLAAIGGDRALRLVYRAGESFIPEVAIAERIQAQWAAVGVRVELDPRYDFSAEIGRLSSDGYPAPDLYLKRIGADYFHPKSFFPLFEKGGNHHTGWEKIDGGSAIERFEELLANADSKPDLESARPLYLEAERLLVTDEAVIVPLYHPDRYYLARSSLRGLGVDRFNFLSVGSVTSAR